MNAIGRVLVEVGIVLSRLTPSGAPGSWLMEAGSWCYLRALKRQLRAT